MPVINVDASLDTAARVWTFTSPDLPTLRVEASFTEAADTCLDRVRTAAGDLLSCNPADVIVWLAFEEDFL